MSEDLTPKTEARNERLRQSAVAGRRARKEALADLILTPHGRRFLWDLLAEANIFSQTYVPDSFDRTAFQEGKRAAGLTLLADLALWFPASYLQMTKENSPVTLPEQDEDNG